MVVEELTEEDFENKEEEKKEIPDRKKFYKDYELFEKYGRGDEVKKWKNQ